MRQGFTSEHWNDDEGHPAGGSTYGVGFAISWQNGPLGRGDDRREPNGAFVEDIIDAARDRIAYYQESGFACEENAKALEALAQALGHLDSRTKARDARGVEGTHSV